MKNVLVLLKNRVNFLANSYLAGYATQCFFYFYITITPISWLTDNLCVLRMHFMLHGPLKNTIVSIGITVTKQDDNMIYSVHHSHLPYFITWKG